MELTPALRQKLLTYQKIEITEHLIYLRLAQTAKSPENRQVLEAIARDELRHYQDWKKHTGQDVPPDRFTVWKYILIGRILGLTFGLKLMESGEEEAQSNYAELKP